MFKKFSSRYGSHWSARHSLAAEWDYTKKDWLSVLQKFPLSILYDAVKDYFAQSQIYPPTLMQLEHLCWLKSGMPSVERVISSIGSHQFDHPLVRKIYNSIGSWNVGHFKKDELEKAIKEKYGTLSSQYMQNPKCFDEEVINDTKQIDYKPTEKERTQFKANWKNWREEAARIKQSAKAPHPVWDKAKFNPLHAEFDQAIFDERKKYLMGLTETEAMTLDSADWYDRTVFFREIEAQKHLAKVRGESGFNRNSEPHRPNQYRSSESKHVYKDWIK
jgi:hypothetical protein